MENKFDDIGFAKLDTTRQNRTGMAETIYCPGKSNEQLLKILQSFHKNGVAVLGTRCTAEQYAYVKDSGLPLEYDTMSRIIKLKTTGALTHKLPGRVAVCTGGTADLPVAEEAAQVAEFFGATVDRHFDVGVTGIHRLLSKIEDIRKADVIIAVAGMEGALSTVLAGLVEAPVISVPTSVGYGASFHGLSPLLTMLNSCAEGISVVNIDNGFGAGVLSCRILRMLERKHD